MYTVKTILKVQYNILFNIILISLFSCQISALSLKCIVRESKIEEYHKLTINIFGNNENFYNYETIVQLMNTTQQNCSLCLFPALKPSLSSEDDVAISVLYGKRIFNIVNWVRSLRSTGCKCKILFFHEPSYISNFNHQELDTINECGVTWCNIGVDISQNYDIHPTTTRFLIIQNFLEAFGNYFRYVMINDVFDTIFQKDPFIPQLFKNNKVVFSIERVQFGNHEYNMKWVKAIDPNWTDSFWRKKYVINNGFEIGNAECVLRLLFELNKAHYFLSNGTTDQAVLNYIYYRDIFTDLWIDFGGDYYISACYSIYNLESDNLGFMHEVSFNNITQAVIHQYDRICSIGRNLLKVCPRLGIWHRYPSGRRDYRMQPCDSLTSINNVHTIY